MKKILCFGDSNTWGHDPKDGSKLAKPWPELLAEKLPNCEIIQDGVCGRTTVFDDPTAEGKNGITAFEERIASKQGADLAILMLGTNDTLNYYKCPAQESAEAMRRFVREWKAAFPESQVLVVSPIEIQDAMLEHPIFRVLYSQTSIEESKKFAACYEKMAKEEGVLFLDAAKYAKASDLDGIHMEPAEHEKLAEAIYTKVLSLL